MLRNTKRAGIACAISLVLSLLLAGCKTGPIPEAKPGQGTHSQTEPWVRSSTNSVQAWITNKLDSYVFRAGDRFYLSFADLCVLAIGQGPGEQIGTNGQVTLPYNVTVVAAGKTVRELQEEIHRQYVPKYFTHLKVTVLPHNRYFYVSGEVKRPSRLIYVKDMTALRAVQTAGDITEFANRKKIEVIRSNGQKFTVNWYKAIKDPKLDLPVFPNDYIIVHRRRF